MPRSKKYTSRNPSGELWESGYTAVFLPSFGCGGFVKRKKKNKKSK
jgi:hypothetical protein